MPQWRSRISHATTKTQCSQINTNENKWTKPKMLHANDLGDWCRNEHPTVSIRVFPGLNKWIFLERYSLSVWVANCKDMNWVSWQTPCPPKGQSVASRCLSLLGCSAAKNLLQIWDLYCGTLSRKQGPVTHSSNQTFSLLTLRKLGLSQSDWISSIRLSYLRFRYECCHEKMQKE